MRQQRGKKYKKIVNINKNSNMEQYRVQYNIFDQKIRQKEKKKLNKKNRFQEIIV